VLFNYADPTPTTDGKHRLRDLRSLDWESLLAKDPRSRWIPLTDIEEVKLSRRPLSRLNTLKSTLTIRTTDSETLKVHLVNDHQVSLAKSEIPKALGSRFRV